MQKPPWMFRLGTSYTARMSGKASWRRCRKPKLSEEEKVQR